MQLLDSPADAAQWLRDRVRGELRTDSRRVQAGDGFIAWPGAATDGRRYLHDALGQGAAACLMEAEGSEPWQDLPGADRLARMPGLKRLLGPVASLYYGEPSQGLDVLAVTGTNGKTSTSWWLAQSLTALGQPCSLVGTLGSGQVTALQSTGLTTPDPVSLQHQFRQDVAQGLRFCAIEASSIGLAEHRLDGTRIRLAIFTNFTQDHLDYHGSMAAYWQAKAALFDWPGLQAAVISVDDPQGVQLAQQLAGRPGLDLWTCSSRGEARLQVRAEPGTEGMHLTWQEGGERVTCHRPLVGDYNVNNLLGVMASLRALGFGLSQAVEATAQLSPVPGRMQRVTGRAGQDPLVLVDYAHTPDAIRQVLRALRPLAQQRDGRLWCLLGCGGDRDASKRPLMAAAAEMADEVILTSDNPRSESAERIVAQMKSGLSRPEQARVELDRAKAIAMTVSLAAARDVVLLAGKGHESTQEIQGVRYAFSDVEQAALALRQRAEVCA